MRRIISLFSFAFLMMVTGAALPQAASAQTYGSRGGLPDGNYQETCRDIRVDNNRLTARCRTNSGYYNSTALNLRECRGGYVENYDGNLVCTGKGNGQDRWGNGYGNDRRGDRWDNGYRDLPQGGYRDTCRDIRVDRDVLTAYCRTKFGDWNYTSLNLRDCRGGNVENKRGVLVCRR
jgi:CVNH domain